MCQVQIEQTYPQHLVSRVLLPAVEGPKQFVNLDVLLDSNHSCSMEIESLEIEDHISEDLLENQDSESSEDEEDGGTGEEFLHPESIKYLGDNSYRVNNSSVVQLDHQVQKDGKTEKVVPVHALSTLVSLALQGDSEESEEEEEIMRLALSRRGLMRVIHLRSQQILSGILTI